MLCRTVDVVQIPRIMLRFPSEENIPDDVQADTDYLIRGKVEAWRPVGNLMSFLK